MGKFAIAGVDIAIMTLICVSLFRGPARLRNVQGRGRLPRSGLAHPVR